MTPQQIQDLLNRVAKLEKDNQELRQFKDEYYKWRFAFKNNVFDDVSFKKRIGFFSKDPQLQQSAPTPTLSEVVTALKNYGLLS